jgi:hypothetical protein
LGIDPTPVRAGQVWVVERAAYCPIIVKIGACRCDQWAYQKFMCTLARHALPATWCCWRGNLTHNIPLESSRRELQVCFRPHPNRRSGQKVVTSQNGRSPNRDSFGTPPWESRDKKPFGCRCYGEAQRILYGGRWWLPPSSGCGESNESMLLVACPNTKPECDLTNLLVGFDAGPSN